MPSFFSRKNRKMNKIIITGHGYFATGLESSSVLIAGKQENVAAVDFPEEFSTEDLRDRLHSEIESAQDGVIILTDLAGGSPYNMSVLEKAAHSNREIAVLSGSNLGVLLSCIFSMEEDPVLTAKTALVEGRDAMQLYERRAPARTEEPDEGI